MFKKYQYHTISKRDKRYCGDNELLARRVVINRHVYYLHDNGNVLTWLPRMKILGTGGKVRGGVFIALEGGNAYA